MHASVRGWQIVKHLVGLKNLKQLNLQKTAVTKDQITHLHQALPNWKTDE
jgi:hypothetical protein